MARILIIEDNPINLELMSYMLQAWQHEVLTAEDGEQGLALIRAQHPDLVLCDLQMPGLDGFGVARALRADPTLSHIPLLAVTALAHDVDRAAAIQAGFHAVFCKPIEPSTFMAGLQPFLSDATGPPRPPSPGREVTARATIPPDLMAPRRPCVLLSVDDGPANLSYKRDLFEPAGYTLLTANSVPRALEMLRQEPVDLVLSDVVMAHGGGFELLRRVREDPAWRDLPFIFLTSSARDSASRDEGLRLGAQQFLLRPLDALDLLRAIRQALQPASN